MVARALGLEDETPEAVNAAILGDPEAALRLKELELSHIEELRRLEFSEYEATLLDKQSARDREGRFVEATGRPDYSMQWLAWTVIVGFFGLILYLMQYPLPKGSEDVTFMLFGALATGFGTVLQYYFGSSKSSSDKTKMLASPKG